MEASHRSIIIAGSASDVGKSSVSVGLMAALVERNLTVQAFKVGPDLEDPLYHSAATGRPSINLDRWFSCPDALKKSWTSYSDMADFCVIEGTMGLLDDLGVPLPAAEGGLLPYNTAQLAKWLGVPILLVMDASKVENSIGAMVRGYCTWDTTTSVNICGIIFNNVRDQEDLSELEAIVSSACPRPIPILGAVPSDDAVQSSELESPFDASVINKKIINLCSLVSQNVDIDRILRLAGPSMEAATAANNPQDPRELAGRGARGGIGMDMDMDNSSNLVSPADPSHPSEPSNRTNPSTMSKNARKRARRKQRKQGQAGGEVREAREATGDVNPLTAPNPLHASTWGVYSNHACLSSEASSDIGSCSTSPSEVSRSCRIAVARDSAFCFYYEENLEMMRQQGLDIVYFSPLTDALPSNVAAVYLGGGMPELHSAALADNRIFRAGMKKFVEAGGVVFAEGGGLLVLCQSLQTRTGFPQQPMVGVFPFRAIMTKGRVLKGYVEISVGDDCPIFPPKSTLRGYMNSNSELVQEQHVGGIMTASEWKGTYRARLFAGKHANASNARAIDVPDGYSTSNVLGSYFHHHFGESPEVLKHFVQKCKQVNVTAVSNAVSGARRMAEFLEGAVAYTPPLTPRRAYLGMMGVHSSPDLKLERNCRSRPQSLDLNGLNGLQSDVGIGGGLPALPDKRHQMPKTQSSGSLGHRTVVDNVVYEYKLSSGAASPVKIGSLADLRAPMTGHDHHPHQHGQQRHGLPGMSRTSHERFQRRLSNNSDCPSFMSSDGSEVAERSSGGAVAQPVIIMPMNSNPVPSIPPLPSVPVSAHMLSQQQQQQQQQLLLLPHPHHQQPVPQAVGAPLGQFGRHAPNPYLDSNTPGPYGDHNRNKSIAVCDSGVRDIIQAFDVQASRLIDVSRHGLGTPIVTDKSFGALQSKSVQALQHFHSRRNSSDAGSELSLGETVENAIKSVFSRASSGPMEIDFEAVAQVKPNVIILEIPPTVTTTQIASTSGSRGDGLNSTSASAGNGGSKGSGGNALTLATERIRRVSPKTKIVVISPISLADVLEGILTIGDAINERDQAIAIVKKVRERLRKVVAYSQKAKLTMGLERRPKIAILSSLHPLTVEGGWVDDLIDLVGGEPLPLEGRKRKVISWEDLTDFAPNVLVVCSPIMNSGDKSAKVFNDLCDIASQPGWWQLPAVKDGVVVISEEALLSRMGLRLIDGAEALARIVYGDAVPTCCMPRSAYLLKLRPGQRVRPRLIPNYFVAYS